MLAPTLQQSEAGHRKLICVSLTGALLCPRARLASVAADVSKAQVRLVTQVDFLAQPTGKCRCACQYELPRVDQQNYESNVPSYHSVIHFIPRSYLEPARTNRTQTSTSI